MIFNQLCRLFSVLGLCLAVSMLGVSTSAQAKTYSVGVEAVNLYPYYDFSSDKPRGYLVDLIRKFSNEQKFKIKFEAMPVDKLWAAYINQEVDFRLPDNLLWQRDMKSEVSITYSVPLVYFKDGIISLPAYKDKPITKLGVIKGFTPWGWESEIDSGRIKKIEANNLSSLIEGLYERRFNGVYYNVGAFLKLTEEAGHAPGSAVFRDNLHKTRSLYMFSSIKHGKLVKAFNQFLRSNSAWVQRRKDHYGLK